MQIVYLKNLIEHEIFLLERIFISSIFEFPFYFFHLEEIISLKNNYLFRVSEFRGQIET